MPFEEEMALCDYLVSYLKSTFLSTSPSTSPITRIPLTNRKL